MGRRVLPNKIVVNPTRKEIAEEKAREKRFLEQIKKEEADTTKRVKKLKDEAGSISESNEVANTELSAKKEEVKEVIEKVSLLKGEEDSKLKVIKELDKDTADKVEKANKDIKEVNDLLNSKKESFDKDVLSMNKDIDSIKYNRKALVDSRAGIIEDISRRNNELSGLLEKVSINVKQLDNTRNAIEKDKKQLISDKEKLKTIASSTKVAEADRIHMNETIARMDKELGIKEGELSELDGDIKKIDDDKLALLKRDIKLKELAGKVKKYYSKAGIKLNLN